MSVDNAWPLLEAISTRRQFARSANSLPLGGRTVSAVTNKKLPCVIQLERSPLRVADAAL